MSYCPAENFVARCDQILNGMDTASIVRTNKMISISSKIAQKHPFLPIQHFLEDFMDGVKGTEIRKKYQLYGHNDFVSVINTLGIKLSRSKRDGASNRDINFRDLELRTQYNFLKSQIAVLQKEIALMLNENILNALVGYALLDAEYILRDDLKDVIMGRYEDFRARTSVLYDKKIRAYFETYVAEELEQKLDVAIACLSGSHLTSMDGDIALPAKYSSVSEIAYKTIHESKDGISYSSFQTKMLNQFPLFRVTHGHDRIKEVSQKLVSSNKIVVKDWKPSPNSGQMFSVENYEYKMQKIRSQTASTVRRKFFGRRITPEKFVSELAYLEHGDLGDLDDQVTRMAGLVLSDAALLQSPREDMKEFDFVVDLSNYNFRQEQVEMMKRLDFQATAKLFHCKVMVDRKVTSGILDDFYSVVPDGEQGVIFTCMPICPEILERTRNDRRVQVLGKDAITKWCSITPTIPCRRHSVATVMYGDCVNKAVLVRSLNYESGLATVEVAPGREETTLPIGSMREVDLSVSDPGDFERISDKYFDFLCHLGHLSSRSLDQCLAETVHGVHESLQDLKKATNPELFEGPHPMTFPDNRFQSARYVQLDDLHTVIRTAASVKDCLECECGHKYNEQYYLTLCKHLVASLNGLFLHYTKMEDPDPSIDRLNRLLERFEDDNVTRTVTTLYSEADSQSRSLLKSYLYMHVDDK